MAVLPQPAEIGLHNLSNLLLAKRFLAKPPFDDLVLKRIAVLSTEDQEVVLLVRTDSPFVQQVVGSQFGDGFAAGAGVLGDDFVDAVAVGGRVGGYLMESAELVSRSVQQIRVRLRLVLPLQGIR